jgi:hypothetical protein
MKVFSSHANTTPGGGIRKYLRWKGILLDLIIALVIVGVGALGYDMWQKRPGRPVGQVGARTFPRSAYLTIREIMVSLEAVQAEGEVQRYTALLGTMDPHDTAESDAAHAFMEMSRNQAVDARDALVQALRIRQPDLDGQFLDPLIEEETILQGAANNGVSIDPQAMYLALASRTSFYDDPPGLHGDTHRHAQDAQSPSQAAPAAIDPAQARDIALAKINQTYDALVRMLKDQHGITISFSRNDFRTYLERREQVSLLRKQIAERLVPETQMPQTLQVDHQFILLTVPYTGTTASQEQREAAFTRVKAQADRIYQQLQQGDDFVALGQAHSANWHEVMRDRSSTGWLPIDDLYPELQQALQQQPLGAIGQPVRTESGWYIIRVLAREVRPDERKLEQMRAEAFHTWVEQQAATLGSQAFMPAPPTDRAHEVEHEHADNPGAPHQP